MMQHRFFDDKKILLVDKEIKNRNDHTWCFWEKEQGTFEPVVHHQWQRLHFYANDFSALLNIVPYQYKMIRSIDFYNYVLHAAAQRKNIEIIHAGIESIGNKNGKAFAVINNQEISCSYLFNSILFHPLQDETKGIYYLLQHFKGWLIETGSPVFDAAQATFMDFRISQQRGTAFVYVLPLSATKALVEYTLFTKNLLQPDDYDQALKEYISNYLEIKEYKICEEEFGIIPMTNKKFPLGEGRIINTGTAGGQTKASSGFTFRFIQKHTDAVVQALISGNDPHIKTSFLQKRFSFYDSVLLQVLAKNKMGGDTIFASLFKKNTAQDILAFLDNETTLNKELKIMNTVPTGIFLPAAIHELLK